MTARGPERVDRTRELLPVQALRAGTGEDARLLEVGRDDGRAREDEPTSALSAASGSSRAPDSATMTGSCDDRRVAGQRVERLGDGLDRRDVAQHPDLHRVDAEVLGHDPDLRLTISRARRSRPPTPRRVFCTVIAVIAVAPWTPAAANAFRSAWMPAPPPESEPAMESTTGDGGARSRRASLGAGARRPASPARLAYAPAERALRAGPASSQPAGERRSARRSAGELRQRHARGEPRRGPRSRRRRASSSAGAARDPPATAAPSAAPAPRVPAAAQAAAGTTPARRWP